MARPAARARFFASPGAWRAWLARNHATEREVWVGFWKAASGRRAMTYEEALEEALCYGWIDGVRRSLDAERWVQRYTPRARRSPWSEPNVRRARALARAGRMAEAGRKAFAARREAGRRGPARLSRACEAVLRADPAAWRGFQALPPGYRGLAARWVMDARRPATRERRLAVLVACSARGERVPPFRQAARRPPRRRVRTPRS